MKVNADPSDRHVKPYLAWLSITLIFFVIVLFFRGPAIWEHRAWSGGREAIQGRLNRNERAFVRNRYYYTVGYSYTVAGRSFRNEFVTTRDLGGLGPVTVTYAKNDPSVSTIYPDTIDSVFRVSVVVAALAFLPLLLVIVLWWRSRPTPHEGRSAK